MPILKLFKCDICGKESMESEQNSGAPGWASFNGINFNGVDNPLLCPDHKTMLANSMDQEREKYK